jgi:hypothetical protein
MPSADRKGDITEIRSRLFPDGNDEARDAPLAPDSIDLLLSLVLVDRESRLLRKDVAEDGKYNVVAAKPHKITRAATLTRDRANIGLGG